jgi:hypothetical protein
MWKINRRRVGRVLAAAGIVAALAATHWLAYRAGEKSEFEIRRALILDFQASVPPDMLRLHNEALRSAAEHRADLTAGELFSVRIRAEQQLHSVEHISIPHAQATGNPDQESRYRSIATTTRDLLAKLPRQ